MPRCVGAMVSCVHFGTWSGVANAISVGCQQEQFVNTYNFDCTALALTHHSSMVLYKLKYMNDERLPFELLSNEWDKLKSKGHPENVGWPILFLGRKN